MPSPEGLVRRPHRRKGRHHRNIKFDSRLLPDGALRPPLLPPLDVGGETGAVELGWSCRWTRVSVLARDGRDRVGEEDGDASVARTVTLELRGLAITLLHRRGNLTSIEPHEAGSIDPLASLIHLTTSTFLPQVRPPSPPVVDPRSQVRNSPVPADRERVQRRS